LLSPKVLVSLDAVGAAAGRSTAGAVLCWEQPSMPIVRRATGTATIIFMINSENKKGK
jgi:hypothetical protein